MQADTGIGGTATEYRDFTEIKAGCSGIESFAHELAGHNTVIRNNAVRRSIGSVVTGIE